jgi:hypothetical protein
MKLPTAELDRHRLDRLRLFPEYIHVVESRRSNLFAQEQHSALPAIRDGQVAMLENFYSRNLQIFVIPFQVF